MNIAAIKKQAVQLESAVEQMKAISYKIYRDDRANLKLLFEDGHRLSLPMLDLRLHQLEVQRMLFIEGVRRLFLVRPRRSGKEVESWNMLIQGALCEPGLYLMVYPNNVRGRKILWDGAIVMPDGSSFRFLDMIPKELIAGKPLQDEMKIPLKNGSFIQVLGSDVDPDALRGTNPRGAIFSEFAYQDPRVHEVLMPVFRQNGGWYILQTTYNGLNHAYQLMQIVKNNPDWFCRVDSALTLLDENGERYISDEMIEADRRDGMAEFKIQQEYYSIVQLNQDSMYFSLEMSRTLETKRIRELEPLNKPVHSAWDLGMNDATAITIFQDDDNNRPYILGYLEGNNKTFEYYIDRLREFCAVRGLSIGKCFSPHDGRKRDFYSAGYKPKDITDFGRELGVEFTVVKQPQSKIMAIQSMRQMIYRCKFDEQEAKRLIDALCNYEKEYDEKSGMYRSTPKHNWASHPVDSFQTMTLAYEEGLMKNQRSEIIYYNNPKGEYYGKT